MDNKVIKRIMEFKFSKIFSLYTDVIKLKASSKKKLDEQKFLLESDGWIQDKLYSVVFARKEPHITKQELVDIMKWKLSRGKWRPRLVQFAESNSYQLVKEASNKAIKFGQENKVKLAIQTLCNLKGVGPATASAILAICVPENFGFFADEVAEAFLHSKPSYTLEEYLQINQELLTIADKLNAKDPISQEWNPHKVELAIWTYSTIEKLDSSLLDNFR